MGVVVVGNEGAAMTTSDLAILLGQSRPEIGEISNPMLARIRQPEKETGLPLAGDYTKLYLTSSVRGLNTLEQNLYIRAFIALQEEIRSLMFQGGVVLANGRYLQIPLSPAIREEMEQNQIVSLTATTATQQKLISKLPELGNLLPSTIEKNNIVIVIANKFLDGVYFSFDNPNGRGFPNCYYADTEGKEYLEIARAPFGPHAKLGIIPRNPMPDLAVFAQNRFTILVNPKPKPVLKQSSQVDAKQDPKPTENKKLVLLNAKAALHAIMLDLLLLNRPKGIDFGKGLPINLGLKVD